MALLPAVGFGELIIFLILLILGIIVILILKAIIHFILPIVAAVVVYLLAHTLLYAGIAFLVVALLQLVLRRK